MKYFLFLLFFVPTFSFATEIYHCESLKGWEYFLEENNDTPKKIEPYNKNGCTYVINENKMTIICDGVTSDPCVVFNNSYEKVEAICVALAVTELYTFSKKEKKLFFVKNGVIGGKGYSMMMSGNCK